MSNDVSIKSVAAQRVVSYRTETTYEEVFAKIPAGFGTVLGFLGERGTGPIGAPFVIFHQAPDADTGGDIAMAVPIDLGSLGESEAAAMASAGIELVEIPGGPVASIIHEGAYSEMGETYASVAAWIHERGHTQTGPGREIYLNSPEDVTEAELRTEIQWPIDEQAVVS